MTYGRMKQEARKFLEMYPECKAAFRYLLTCPYHSADLLQLRSKYHVSLALWRRCYNRFGQRNGVRWIQTIVSHNHPTKVQIVPEDGILSQMQDMVADEN